MTSRIHTAVLTLSLALSLAGGPAFADGVSKSTTTTQSNGAGNLRAFDAKGDSFRLKTANFISAHGQCRYVRNNSGEAALYIPLKRADEWRQFYESEGGDAAQVLVCCEPVTVEICGQNVALNFMIQNDTTTLEAGHSRVEAYRCASNNNVVKQSETGQCSSPASSGGGDGGASDRDVDRDGVDASVDRDDRDSSVGAGGRSNNGGGGGGWH